MGLAPAARGQQTTILFPPLTPTSPTSLAPQKLQAFSYTVDIYIAYPMQIPIYFPSHLEPITHLWAL